MYMWLGHILFQFLFRDLGNQDSFAIYKEFGIGKIIIVFEYKA